MIKKIIKYGSPDYHRSCLGHKVKEFASIGGKNWLIRKFICECGKEWSG